MIRGLTYQPNTNTEGALMLDIMNTLLYNEGCSVDKSIDAKLTTVNALSKFGIGVGRTHVLLWTGVRQDRIPA